MPLVETNEPVDGKVITINIPIEQQQLLDECALALKRLTGGRHSISRVIRILVNLQKKKIHQFIGGDEDALGNLNVKKKSDKNQFNFFEKRDKFEVNNDNQEDYDYE